MNNILSIIKKYISQHKQLLFVTIFLSIVSFIHSTHLSYNLIPNGYDLLFHLGNVFALQIKLGFVHNSLASFAISPIIFHDYGYGTHLFYPPLAHVIPAVISFLLAQININSTLLAIRLFSFITLFLSGISIYYVAKKISNNSIYSFFASLLYLSAPYLHMDYYWRGGMSSSLCFVFLPILILSLYYFTKEKFAPFLFTFVISMTLIAWTHIITAFFSFIIFSLVLLINLFYTKKKKMAVISSVIAVLMIGIMTSPFWSLLIQQYAFKTHIIFSNLYPFTIKDVAEYTIDISQLFDIQFDFWNFSYRNLFAIFNLLSIIFFLILISTFGKIKRIFKDTKFLYSLIGLVVLLIIMITTKSFWLYLPNFFAFIQFPHRLLLQVTPILSLLIALPFILIKKITPKKIIVLGILSISIVSYTFMFNSYEMYELGQIDYTTHSIIQAMGVEQEYLPVKTKEQFESFDERPYLLIPLTNLESSTPSASITTNETPYLKARISNNQGRKTEFELPRLFYLGYRLNWTPEGNNETTSLSYNQSKNGLIKTIIPGNGTLEVQYTGGWWYPVLCLGSTITLGYLILLIYKYSFTKKFIWLEKN